MGISNLCKALTAFSDAASDEPGIVTQYCSESFPNHEPKRKTCVDFFNLLSTYEASDECKNVATLIFSYYNSPESPALNSPKRSSDIFSFFAIPFSFGMIIYIIFALSKIDYRRRWSEIMSKES